VQGVGDELGRQSPTAKLLRTPAMTILDLTGITAPASAGHCAQRGSN
jgi:hypothetical protein